MSPRIKIYQVARMLGLDYYQAMKRVMELAKKGFLKVVNGSMTITNEGTVLKEILAQVIVLMHASDANSIRER
jgi:predicted transcriptional regulator